MSPFQIDYTKIQVTETGFLSDDDLGSAEEVNDLDIQKVCAKYHQCHCNCDRIGSVNNTCNANEECSCKDGFSGTKCNKCASNFHSFPDCKGMRFNYDISKIYISGAIS